MTIDTHLQTHQQAQPTTWLVTSVIGMHTSLCLPRQRDRVIGLDNLSDYCDISLRQARLAQVQPHTNFSFHQLRIANREGVATLFATGKPQRVIHLAAQASVRYSFTNPARLHRRQPAGLHQYSGRPSSQCRAALGVTSSVYSGNMALPFIEHHNIDYLMPLYTATKKANELMAPHLQPQPPPDNSLVASRHQSSGV